MESSCDKTVERTIFSLKSGTDQRKELIYSSSNAFDHEENPLKLCTKNRKNILSEIDFSMLKHSLSRNNGESQSSVYVDSSSNSSNGSNGAPFQPLQCATSIVGSPTFPNPSTNNGHGLPLSAHVLPTLQPRITSAGRRSRHFVPDNRKDDYYWQKRRKNNEAARKSREKRRTIDSVLEEKVMILTHENKMLRNELYALKVKHGEITPDGNDDKTEAVLDTKTNIDSINSSDQAGLLSQRIENQMKNGTIHSSISPIFTSAATITLPQVKVILEKDNSPHDHSAKLVLSNLASGKLILSPVSLSCRDKAPSDILHLESKTPNHDYVKAAEAASALATMSQSNGNGDFNHLSAAESQSKRRSSDSSSPRSLPSMEDASAGALKMNQSLPHKLRFKVAKFD